MTESFDSWLSLSCEINCLVTIATVIRIRTHPHSKHSFTHSIVYIRTQVKLFVLYPNQVFCVE